MVSDTSKHIGAEDPAAVSTKVAVAVSPRKAAMEAVENVVYGSVAGGLAKCIEYPFDTVKVRLQSQPDHVPLRYRGPLDCFRQSMQANGIAGLYRGISAPLVGSAVETSSLFFFERLGRETVFAAGLCPRNQSLPLAALFYTGALAGSLASFILTPIELVKCKIQVPEAATTAQCLNPIAVIRHILRHEGLRGFWHGQTGTLIRETGGSASWFGAHETTALLLREWNVKKCLAAVDARQTPGLQPAELATLRTAPLPLWQQALAGASAGISYNLFLFPADTVKSRMQTAPVGSVSGCGTVSNRTFLAEAKALWQLHGLKGFYRGCGITVLRSAPSSALIFVCYDCLKTHLPMA